MAGERTGISSADRLKGHNPRLRWTAGHVETEVFPFTGYLSFSRDGAAEDEDVVGSVGVQRNGGRLIWTSDISTGEGEIG